MAITDRADTLASINNHFASMMQEAFEKDNSFLKSLKGDPSLSLAGEINYKFGLGDMPSASTTRIKTDTAAQTANAVVTQRAYYPVLEQAINFEMSNSLSRRSDINGPLMAFLSQTPEVVIDSINETVIARIKGVIANETALETATAGSSVFTDESASTGITAANRISRDNVLKTLALLGERGNQAKYMVMHSNTYWALRSLEDADFFRHSDKGLLGGAGGFTGESYLGMDIIVDDNLTAPNNSSATTHYVVLYADGAFTVNRSNPEMLFNPYDIFKNGSGTKQTNAVWLHTHNIEGYSYATGATTPGGVDPANTGVTDESLDQAAVNLRIVGKQNLKFCMLRVNSSSL